MHASVFARLSWFATALALVVVVLGAYVRLSDAGLGCPDWPGCYGQIDVPRSAAEVARAEQAYPERPVEPAKAWKEMVHRYFAGTLGLIIAALAFLAWRNRDDPRQLFVLPALLVLLVVFQAALGMWTVTLLLKPVVVMAHLLGGMSILAILWWLWLRSAPSSGQASARSELRRLRPWALLALVVLMLQISLGGWTSANYAALHCPDFPTCQGRWWPPMDVSEGFTLWRGLGVDYEGGVLGNDARVAIHVMHRIGALITLVVLGWVALRSMAVGRYSPRLRTIGLVLLIVLVTQVSLGIGNVVLSLPLPVAVAHNGVGALLLLTLVTLNHALNPKAEVT
ncbi:MAG: COX15/CtaA family protein [Pseudomonadota bacterium]|nr:MAG: COX15/CtaA family protein [Pseudomonadota bacterium]